MKNAKDRKAGKFQLDKSKQKLDIKWHRCLIEFIAVSI